MTVVIAAEGYPAAPVKGDEITGTERAGHDHAYVLHAGTASERQGRAGIGGRPGAERGRLGARTSRPRAPRAYELAGTVRMRGGWYRRDIAARP